MGEGVLEDFQCEIKIKPMEDWVNEEDDKLCHPCLLQPLASNYLDILKQAGASKQAEELEKAWASADVLTVARVLDKIKKEVGDKLKKNLVKLDCFTQSFEPELPDSSRKEKATAENS